MSKSFTPGPWGVDTVDAHIVVASVYPYEVKAFSEEGDEWADAQLIAAAPIMFELLIAAHNRLVELGEAEANDLLLPRIREALAKATGGDE